MQLNLENYCKQHEVLVCIDSDGCAMDTMEIKHRNCFATELIREWNLFSQENQVREIWYDINLYSYTRGINRFKGLCMTLEILSEKGFLDEDLKTLINWVKTASELSNRSLQEELVKNNSMILQKSLNWSIAVNKAIENLAKDDKPFDGVLKALENICQSADIAVVSSANEEALNNEWVRHNLTQYVQLLLSQQAGSKAYCIGQLYTSGYDRENILMVGDAPGDLDAAIKNEVKFYPILVGREIYSWHRLQNEAFQKLKNNDFTKEYQEKLINEFKNNLGL